jgi:Carboxypeptidase regulatory-like domain/TonB dependent receptor
MSCGRRSPVSPSALALIGVIVIAFLISRPALSQSASTGAVVGVTFDSSGAVVPDATLELFKDGDQEKRKSVSDANGRFEFLSLPPGRYVLQANKINFDPLRVTNLNVHVTETLRLDMRFRIATHIESTQVLSEPRMLQPDSSALGNVVNARAVSDLPLVTRNFAQIAGLSPGVVMGVYNAGELGLGGIALTQIATSNDGIYVHGARSYDNNYQIDGISVNDVQGSGASSGGIPIPSPDAIEEFKMQTALYDAAYGRYGGANVSLVTKSGSNVFHGSAFEFFRNNVLNANDFFLKQTGQPRAALRQNQYGFTLGGPIAKDKLLFFISYQGTRQINGLASGQARVACTASLSEPPLTNDRSPASLGKLFGGMSGALGGEAVNADGSNINPAALNLLNLKLPNGTYLIPTPQTVVSSNSFDQQGFSVFTEPCDYNQNQFSTNFDYLATAKSRLSLRFLFGLDGENVTFPGNGVNPAGNIPGFPSSLDDDFALLSLAHTYTFNSNLLNEARFGFLRTTSDTKATTAFKWSDIGVSEGEMSENNELPSLSILGSVSVASGFPRKFAQNTFVFADNLSFFHEKHTIRVGGSVTRLQDDVNLLGLGSLLRFLSWPDFLLGLSAADNGSAFSNVFASLDDFGLTTREYRQWEASAFVQDDYRIAKTFTVNLGLRYERLGQFGDDSGKNASFDVAKADPNPPASGSLAGYLVASNFPGTAPAGVERTGNTFGNYGEGQNTFGPRVGFAWQVFPNLNRFLVRGGYGAYYSLPTGQAFYQNLLGAPFSEFRIKSGAANAVASFATPFQQPFPTPSSFPLFPVYSPTSAVTVYSIAPGFRPSMIQQFSLNIQAEFSEGWLLQVGYVGARGTHLMRQRSLNQALAASSSSPIRGVTDNTLANLGLRVPILGIPPDSLQEMESEGSSWYNGLEASLTKRMSRGLQFIASYTFSKTLDTDGADVNSTSTGNALTLGNQDSPAQRWGRASFDRTHRFVFSETWALPGPTSGISHKVLAGWELAAVATIQSGTALTIGYTNASNVFGIDEDRAQLSGACSKGQLVTGGTINSKLNNYFNVACFASPPIIGADGIGTAFGNSETGIVDGPGQANLDLAVSKTTALNWPVEGSAFQLRAEFFNTFNHPQFANPDTTFGSPTFGVINGTAVNPRVMQLALKFIF